MKTIRFGGSGGLYHYQFGYAKALQEEYNNSV